jgi:2-polyprenyl-3-methyl-5-hydroxy-6-metoxy-1,4-benzoquinol methylase
MLPFIPAGIGRILEIGCGSGTFGQLLRQQPGLTTAYMVGIEMDQASASEAAGVFDTVHCSDFQTAARLLEGKSFDCVVCNDVLEHMVDPWAALGLIRGLLSPGGYVVASIPNVRFWGVVRSLLWDGNWTYANDGVLDRTHLRFFTRASMVEMFSVAGYEVEQARGINSLVSGWPFKIANFLSRHRFTDMQFLQFALVARIKNGDQAALPH